MAVERVPCSCTELSFAQPRFWYCKACDNRRRLPYLVDLRGKTFDGAVITQLPPDFDFKYDDVLADPVGLRSDMIRMLDDPAWRTANRAAEAQRQLDEFNALTGETSVFS